MKDSSNLQHISSSGSSITPVPSGVLQRTAISSEPMKEIPSIVYSVLHSPGQSLDRETRTFMEPRFGHDFSHVQIHSDARAAESARSVNAAAFTVGEQIVFGTGQYSPGTSAGRRLMAHELSHVVQQNGNTSNPSTIGLGPAGSSAEMEAESAAQTIAGPSANPHLAASIGSSLQRKVEMRDVGRGEQSGFARLPELIDRLNGMSQALTYSMTGKELTYIKKEGATPGFFDTQMMGFIDQNALVPLRLTNRHGLLGTKSAGFHAQVDVDAFNSGYVDIDDLLASNDLGLQSVLVHFLRERSVTSNYAHRIGSDTFTDAEFQRAHGLGIQSEEELLRDFFGDPSIRIVNDSPSPTVRRAYRNSRRDIIRRRVTRGKGDESTVEAMSIDVLMRDGKVLTADEYKKLLQDEKDAKAAAAPKVNIAPKIGVGTDMGPPP